MYVIRLGFGIVLIIFAFFTYNYKYQIEYICMENFNQRIANQHNVTVLFSLLHAKGYLHAGLAITN